MVNEVRTLLRQAAEESPHEETDLSTVLAAGRSRVRRRRLAVVGAVAAVATVGTAGVVVLEPGGSDPDRVAEHRVPRPDGPVLRLSDAGRAVAGRDYEQVASHTNRDLNQENGQYFDGVTEDGQIVFRDGPRTNTNQVRIALRDPETGRTDWLPAIPSQLSPRPVALNEDRLVFAVEEEPGRPFRVLAFERATRTWSQRTWPTLPVGGGYPTAVAPDGRIYVGVEATTGSVPPGGWPTGPDGDAEDAGAEGDTYDLWSVSPTDPSDVRDERLRVGSFDLTDTALVWSTATNGTNRRIHVRDLATGAEHDFDPRSGKRCNLLGFSASGDKIVLGQYCGTYDDGRDDRVQVLTTEGRTVTTIQGSSIDGGLADGDGDGHLVTVRAWQEKEEGTYVYDLDDGRFLRLTDSVSSWALGGPTRVGELLVDVAYGEGRSDDPEAGSDLGATQRLIRWAS